MMLRADILVRVDAKAEETEPYEGKPAWHGYYRRPGRPWKRATSKLGPIIYKTEDAARAGALACAHDEIERTADG